MMSRSLAKALVTELAEAGVDTVFGLPGGGPNLEMIGAALGAGMRFVLAHGETAACIMASTYGLLAGHPGLCIVTRGPGLTSAVNGIAQATLDRFPLVLVSDRVPKAHASRVPHQRLPQLEVTRPVTKWCGTLGVKDPAALVAAAVALAAAPPAGAVHLDFDPTADGDPAPAPPPALPGSDGTAVHQARALLRASRRPIFLLGPEAIPWTAAVRQTVLASRCPALTTYHAKGLVPDSWPNAGGLFTNGAAERALVEQADLILAVGLDLVEPIPAAWPYQAPIVVVHPWPLADSYFQPTVQLVGAVDELLAALRDSLHSDWPPHAGRAAKERVRSALFADVPGLTPHDVVEVTRRATPADAMVTVDAGAHMLVAMPLWPVEEPRQLLISNGLATMGFSVPAAVAAALARPRRRVVCFVGDGGLGMTLAELETIARLWLNVAVVVLNDAALSLIEVKQEPHHGGTASVRYGPTDFAAVAAAVGLPAAVVTNRDELERQLQAHPDGPVLVDARVNPAVYPHVIRVTRG
jgi:acetolactate synthase-1/2/3 large subunit